MVIIHGEVYLHFNTTLADFSNGKLSGVVFVFLFVLCFVLFLLCYCFLLSIKQTVYSFRCFETLLLVCCGFCLFISVLFLVIGGGFLCVVFVVVVVVV